MNSTDHSSRFFRNTECEHFPCHPGVSEEEFNCLFCYCPLYHMDCPGNYEMTEAGGKTIKNCKDCVYPHMADNYPEIIKRLKSN